MFHKNCFLPLVIEKSDRPALLIWTGFLVSLVFISLFAQLTVPLPWTPVPITGQTFAITLIALTWGAKRGLALVLAYMSLGALGIPLFAMGKSGLFWGPTLGYLIGMIFSAYIMGYLADLGATKFRFTSWVAAIIGSFITFIFGLLVLSFFVPSHQLLALGLTPFLLGELLKTLGASQLAYLINKKIKEKAYFTTL